MNTTLEQFNKKQEERFDKGCNTDNISDPPSDREWIKSFIKSSNKALVKQIAEGEIERLEKEVKIQREQISYKTYDLIESNKNVSEIIYRLSHELTDKYNQALQDQITHWKAIIKTLE